MPRVDVKSIGDGDTAVIDDVRRDARPVIAAVGRAIDAGAGAGVLRRVRLAGADVDRVAARVVRIDREAADAVGAEPLADPAPSRIVGAASRLRCARRRRPRRRPTSGTARRSRRPARSRAPRRGRRSFREPLAPPSVDAQRPEARPRRDPARIDGPAIGDAAEHPVLRRGRAHDREACRARRDTPARRRADRRSRAASSSPAFPRAPRVLPAAARAPPARRPSAPSP